MKKNIFFKKIRKGIPKNLPRKQKLNDQVNHAPSKKHNLSKDEVKLALQNALRYFPPNQHQVLIEEFKQELRDFGKIYMYRFKPKYAVLPLGNSICTLAFLLTGEIKNLSKTLLNVCPSIIFLGLYYIPYLIYCNYESRSCQKEGASNR